MIQTAKRIDIDALARKATVEVAAKPDLLKDGVPLSPGLWHVVVEPIQARTTSDGGIIQVVEESQKADEVNITVGRILALGPSAFAGKTESGVPLWPFVQDVPGIKEPRDLIGHHVFYQKFTGQKLTLRKTGQVVFILADSELLGYCKDPNVWRFYL